MTRTENYRTTRASRQPSWHPKATPEDLRAYVEGRKRLENEFSRRIFHQAGAAEAVTELQRHHLPRGTLLHCLARFAVEVQLYWQPSNTGIQLRGAITFPSANEARRADLFSRKVSAFAREMKKFQATSVPPEIVLGLWFGKTEEELKALAETTRSLPASLENYADYLLSMSRSFRPKRGRRGHPALDSLTRDLVQGVLKTLDEALVSTYGVLKPLAVLIGAAYRVAGTPRRISPKTLKRLLDENRT